jgi:hypothetical protein
MRLEMANIHHFKCSRDIEMQQPTKTIMDNHEMVQLKPENSHFWVKIASSLSTFWRAPHAFFVRIIAQ